jgi:hypothetical protein
LDLRAPTRIRFLAPFTLVLFSASTAHAQRIPNEFLWFAGTSLFAPFAAIPLKLVILRLLKRKAACSRLWSISAIEFLLWFPIGYFALRFGRSTSAPVIVLALFASVVWTHTAFLTNTSWRSAFFLSLPTPVVALLLPFMAFWIAVLLN